MAGDTQVCVIGNLAADEAISAQGLTGCVKPGCGKRLVGRGLCRRHYNAWYRNTSPDLRPPARNLKRLTPAERFARKVTRRGPDDCWEWTGSTYKFGHGEFFVSPERGKVPAHSFALELATGERCPPGKEACHDCDNPPCCNPAHLYYGTRQQNVDDMYRRGRARVRPLDPQDVRRLYQRGHGATRIATDLRVSLARVHRVMDDLKLPRRPAGRVPKAA